MLNKIHQLYKNSILISNQPEVEYSSQYYWFRDTLTGEWLGVPVQDTEDKELLILKALFEFHEPSIYRHSTGQTWYNFLFRNGPLPSNSDEFHYRIIQFQCSGNDWERADIEMAMKGFFHDDLIIFWENERRGIIIDTQKEPILIHEDFNSIAQTIESDFYIKVVFYVGKFYPLSKELLSNFKIERNFFDYSMELKPQQPVLTFEKKFPSVLTKQLSEELKGALTTQLLDILKEDPELLLTIKVFLENNLNATLTAKKLYIHRNTLQYRIDKFSEKTGVNLKDFESAITVYITCLLSDMNT